MSKIKYKLNGGWTELSAADINAATDSIIINETGSPTNSKNIKADTKLYIDNTESNVDDSGTIIRVQTTNVTWPLSVDKGGTGTDSITNFINSIKTELFKEMYPVGSIYMSINNTDPTNLFGGSWTPLKGMFLLGADDNYQVQRAMQNTPTKDGGEATVTLSAAESGVANHTHGYGTYAIPNHTHSRGTYYMPSHDHTIAEHNNSGSGSLWAYGTVSGTYKYSNAKVGNTGGSTSVIGGNSGNPNSLPYITGSSGNPTTTASAAQPHNNMPPYLVVYMWKRIK